MKIVDHHGTMIYNDGRIMDSYWANNPLNILNGLSPQLSMDCFKGKSTGNDFPTNISGFPVNIPLCLLQPICSLMGFKNWNPLPH